ncbi:MAG: membrane protein insertase YidC, partial [Alphaproteobacteria bacterium]|nr:membrane protein insertase YidC [Alphaproteobacteria bacterium]
MGEQRNFLIAIGISMALLFVWQVMFGNPALEKRRAEMAAREQAAETETPEGVPPIVSAEPAREGDGVIPTLGTTPKADAAPVDAPDAPRVAIDTPALRGSVALKGGRLDRLQLKNYHVLPDPDGCRAEKLTKYQRDQLRLSHFDPETCEIVLLAPSGTAQSQFADFGWAATGQAGPVPSSDTLWRQANAGALTPTNALKLYWDNGQGLRFVRTIAVDELYMFTVTDEVENRSSGPVSLAPFGRVYHAGMPTVATSWIEFEGLLGVIDGTLKQSRFKALLKDGAVTYDTKDGWIGVTDKYWIAALAPVNSAFKVSFRPTGSEQRPSFQADYVLPVATVAPGGSHAVETHLFAGAKKVDVVESYGTTLGIRRFDFAIDWGALFFLTKPFFHALEFLNRVLPGGFAWAILTFTVLVKLAFFPLANKSYEAMSKMKKLQPEMTKLRERFKDDKVKQQQELMELYKKEKVNPLAGCLPILVQIPVFFALYNVLFVTIEMRHEPFIGWIRDLSAPDPTSLFNLFGLLPYDPTALPFVGSLAALGFWPIVMGLTMWLQMQMNPPPPDPIQARIFQFMPLVFTFLLAKFAVGLVIYWAWNNTLSLLQ